jgi:predicted DNA-binding transcriptional regulator AlpA
MPEAGTETRPASPDLISVPDAARRLKIHPETGYRLCRAGAFPGAVHIGRHWWVSVPRFERYLHGDATS